MPDRRLNGFNPLSYLGTNPYTPADTVIHPRDPVSTDFQNFELGTFWLNSVNESLWVLVNLNQNVATWVELSIGSTGTIDKLRTSDGNDVTPTAGRIVLANGSNITTTGTVGPNTVTISVSGTTNHSIQLGNASGSLTSLGVATNGQLPIGSAGADPVLSTLTAGSGISISNGVGSITIATSGTIATSYPTDSGTAAPAANILNVFGGTAGRDINTTGSGNTIHVELNNAITLGDLSAIAANSNALSATTGDINIAAANLKIPGTNSAGTQGVIFSNATRFIHNWGGGLPGGASTFVGFNAGNFTASVGANQNTGIGQNALQSITTAQSATGIGTGALGAMTTVGISSALGTNAGAAVTTGGYNDFIGCNAAYNGTNGVVTGSFNVVIGSGSHAGTIDQAGFSYQSTESSNIIIRNIGVTGENNVMRLGTSGSGNGQVNKCFIAGITGVNVGSVAKVVSIAASGDQLGSTTITAGAGITVTAGANTITIASSGTSTLTYTNVNTTPYVVLTTDEYLGVDCSGAPITIQLPNAPSTGRVFIIKDRTGSANTNNITVTTVGGAVNIDGATTHVMNTQYASIEVLFDGTTYQIF